MNFLLGLRDKCREIYADYDLVIRPVLKFGLAVLIFMIINKELGYLSALNNLFVLIVLAVICAILPLNGMVLIGTLLIVAHCFGLGMEVGGFAAILYLLMLLLYFRFASRDALAILLTPVAFVCRVPAAIPLGLGQIRGGLSSISIVFGLISWQFIKSVPAVIEPLKSVPDTSLLDILQAMPNALLTAETILQCIIFVVVFLIVAALRRLGSDYAHEVGIVVGAIVYLFLQIIGGRWMDLEVDFTEILICAVGSLLIAFFLKIFYFNADYAASERLIFEDDRYYYRVKVIPKLNPVDSKTGELLEPEPEEEMPYIEAKRFRKLQEEEMEQKLKFQGINLQSVLERKLRNFAHGEEAEERAEAAGTPEAAEESTAKPAQDRMPEEAPVKEELPKEAPVKAELPKEAPLWTEPGEELLEKIPAEEMPLEEASPEEETGREESAVAAAMAETQVFDMPVVEMTLVEAAAAEAAAQADDDTV
ncbi:MAG: hypothetical protein K5852_07150 [Eubacterium sp.]|nr:hypothetical protein [Eubacterium sp.]